MVTIKNVQKGSLSYHKKIVSGDKIISINDNIINDILDYRFYITEKIVNIKLLKQKNGKEKLIKIKKEEYDDIGLDFETFLMDCKKSCTNKCIFCFIDQLPEGMRETLYFKDDDDRLSFLQGNYVTLTNVDYPELDRLIKMHISPINVSVHTTNPDLRCKMLNNRFAGDIMNKLSKLADAGIQLNCQIVLCRGINDGKELINTMHDLQSLYPAVSSVAIVPAGITDHRDGLYELTPFTSDECRDIIKMVDDFAIQCQNYHGERIFYCSDEFYLSSDTDIPDEDFYNGYPQLENGVGMIANMRSEVQSALDDVHDYTLAKNISFATGEAAYPLICELAGQIKNKAPNFNYNVYCIKNKFFGKNITVAGLITATDIIDQLQGKDLGEELHITKSMLRAGDDVFLDDITLSDLQKQLQVPIVVNDNTGYDFIDKIFNNPMKGNYNE